MAIQALAKNGTAELAPVADGSIQAMIEKVLSLPDFPVDKLHELLSLQERVETERARKAFLADFAVASAEMEPIRKDARNPDTKSKYATHAALDAAMRPIYTKYGFGYSWNTGIGDGSPIPPECVRVIGILSHKIGHERHFQIDMPADGKGAKGGAVMSRTHATGSAFSYGCRYLQKGSFNIVFAGEDDDGNRAGKVPTAPDANEPISKAQLDELLALADDVGADKARFCKFYNIASFTEITVSQFDKAKRALEAKRK